MRQRRRLRKSCGFTLIELLVAISLTAIMLSLLMGSLASARSMARKAVCAATLHDMGTGLGAYITDHNDYMPYVEEPLWTGSPLNWNADPTDEVLWPKSFIHVMGSYLPPDAIFVCGDAKNGYPLNAPKMTYRVASANNADGIIYYNGSNSFDAAYGLNATTKYRSNLKYLDGRRYEMRHFDIVSGQFVNRSGDFYLIRDFNYLAAEGEIKTVHNEAFNQLYLDLHVALYPAEPFGLTYP